MWRGFLLAAYFVVPSAVLIAADSAAPQSAQIAAGSISSTAAVVIDGTPMLRAAAPSWPLVDQDEIATTSAPAQLRTPAQSAVTLRSETRARIRTTQPGQLYVYLRSGGLNFDTKANGVSFCAHDRLYVPAMPAKGSLNVSASGMVTVSGLFAEAGERPCTEDGFAGLPTAIPGAGGATAGAAGGTAIGTGAGAAAAGGTVAAVAGVAAVGSAAAAGLATTASGSTCSGAAGCNFNAAPVSASSPQ